MNEKPFTDVSLSDISKGWPHYKNLKMPYPTMEGTKPGSAIPHEKPYASYPPPTAGRCECAEPYQYAGLREQATSCHCPKPSVDPQDYPTLDARRNGQMNRFVRRGFRNYSRTVPQQKMIPNTVHANPPRTPRNTPNSPPHHPPHNIPNHIPESAYNPILHQLEPFVYAALSRFNRPDSPEAIRDMTDQVIALAISMPEIGECMRASEMSAWGRASLLRTVVALLIEARSESFPVDDRNAKPEKAHR